MKLVSADIDRYSHDHTQPRPAIFQELREHTHAHVPMPQMQVGRIEGTLLKLLVALVGAKRVVEIGTYTGYSALCMAEALGDDGELITCDIDEKVTAIARSFFDRTPHGSKIRIALGDALETAKSIEGPIDLVFMDADKARYPLYYEELLPKIRIGGLMVIDNVLWSGAVLDPQTDDARGIVEVNRMVLNDPRVENVLLPVRDGVMIARRVS